MLKVVDENLIKLLLYEFVYSQIIQNTLDEVMQAFENEHDVSEFSFAHDIFEKIFSELSEMFDSQNQAKVFMTMKKNFLKNFVKEIMLYDIIDNFEYMRYQFQDNVIFV